MHRFSTLRSFLKTDFGQLAGVRTAAAQGQPRPAARKPVLPGQKMIDLPAPDDAPLRRENVRDCIAVRSSVRRYAQEPMTLAELAYLLWATQGVRGTSPQGASLRTVPSAGATHTLETCLLVRSVDGLTPGIYRYQPFEHQLILLRTTEDAAGIIDEMTMADRQPFVPYFAGKAAVVFAWSTIPARAEWKFDVQAHKKILIDAGHVCQNLYIAGESIDVGVCAIGIYDQAKMDALLSLDGDEEFVVYLAAAGRKP